MHSSLCARRRGAAAAAAAALGRGVRSVVTVLVLMLVLVLRFHYLFSSTPLGILYPRPFLYYGVLLITE